jgi:hypothetical protein
MWNRLLCTPLFLLQNGSEDERRQAIVRLIMFGGTSQAAAVGSVVIPWEKFLPQVEVVETGEEDEAAEVVDMVCIPPQVLPGGWGCDPCSSFLDCTAAGRFR